MNYNVYISNVRKAWQKIKPSSYKLSSSPAVSQIFTKKEFVKLFFWLPIISELFPAFELESFHFQNEKNNLGKKLYVFNASVTTVLLQA